MLPSMEQMRWTLTSTLSKVAGEPCCPSVCLSVPVLVVGALSMPVWLWVSGLGWGGSCAGLCVHPQWEMAPGQGQGAQSEGWGSGG